MRIFSTFSGIGGLCYNGVMANKYIMHPIPPRQELEQLYSTGLTQKKLGERYGVTQKVVHSWFRKLDIKSRVPKNLDQQGEKNASWKGDNAGYAANHYRVQKLRGKPMICSRCNTTDAKRYEWASLTKNYSDPYDYIRLCKSCHATFDKVVQNFNTERSDDNESI